MHHFALHSVISHYGYFGVFGILMMEMIGVPFPAETTLTVAGFEWTKGTFSLVPLLLSAAAGNIVGSTIAYGIGYWLGRPVILRFGRYVGISEARLSAAEAKFTKYRSTVVLFAKFIAGIRVLVPYLAGINRMQFWLFMVYNAVSALAWSAFFIIVGRYIGVAWSRYHAVMHDYLLPLLIVVLIGAGVYFGLKNRKKRREDK